MSKFNTALANLIEVVLPEVGRIIAREKLVKAKAELRPDLQEVLEKTFGKTAAPLLEKALWDVVDGYADDLLEKL